MKYRRLGKTDFEVSEVSLGTWQVGGGWGSAFDDETAQEILNTAVDRGISFLDTADVYDDRASEAAVGTLVHARSEPLRVATQCGRRLQPHVADSYTPAAMREFVEQSLENTGLETLDLIQLHCPPTEVYYRPEVFEIFDRLKEEGKIRNLGVSVEKVEEGLKAIEYPGVVSVQMIYNIFRQRPADLFFGEARARNVAVIVRVPLASGLLTGKMTRETTFDPEDHRNFNRQGAAFDVGETFAGVPYEAALDAVEELRALVPEGVPMAAFALRWILMEEAVSVVIPGARNPAQARANAAADEVAPLAADTIAAVREIYDRRIAPHVHQRW